MYPLHPPGYGPAHQSKYCLSIPRTPHQTLSDPIDIVLFGKQPQMASRAEPPGRRAASSRCLSISRRRRTPPPPPPAPRQPADAALSSCSAITRSLSRTLSRGTRAPDERPLGGTCRHVARGSPWRALLTITRGADERSRAAHRHSANGITEARALTR